MNLYPAVSCCILRSDSISCSLLPSSFDFAFDLARFACKEKIPEIHLKHAMYLEDEVNPSQPCCVL